ncbi:uncharacterized protein FIBRA_02549 [Fibroporia radiculosa]|uniref:Peptidase C14 caspase domain-containing protein n=1 Tax=Fibroporia radiculosa TaxID=599839 RepID=J4GMZ0_9APHY|nr:uncharacterized protein FIBRA_02549 [Fibroporia radiculosa]CCM00515.1 predicted protein [Fibroporia radiculosa]
MSRWLSGTLNRIFRKSRQQSTLIANECPQEQKPFPDAQSFQPRLFALVIGINNYAAVSKLRGAVLDADAVKDYLEKYLNVPGDQIRNLRDKEATRSAIIQAFRDIRNDARIKSGDPILIYFAGHGSELPPPPGWEADGLGSKIQFIVPQDYSPRVNEVQGIPDRTVGALIEEIAREKGDNITVIFDCCHSASGTRDDRGTILTRAVELVNNVPLDLDRVIWGSTGQRGAKIAAGFAHVGLRSHVLLSACSKNERATEERGRGRFTKALLLFLEGVGADKVTYTDVLNKMEKIGGQNPQCEGHHQNRIMFNAKVPTRGHAHFPVYAQENQYRIEAGSAHGVSEGAEFTIYRDKELTKPLIVLVADTEAKILPYQSILTPKDGKFLSLPEFSVALQTKIGEEGLVLYVPDSSLRQVLDRVLEQMQAIGPDLPKVSLVSIPQVSDNAKLEVTREDGFIIFKILDPLVASCGLTRIPFKITPVVEDIYPIFRAAAHYYWHLNRSHDKDLIRSGADIKVDFYPLEESDSDFDEDLQPTLYPIGPSLCQNGIIDFVVDEDARHGVKITNNTSMDLYPNVFFFDNSDLSIQSYYTPSTAGQYQLDSPLTKDGGILTIGYGTSGVPAISYFLRPEQDIDVGLIKIFLTTRPVDMSMIPQTSPFLAGRDTPSPSGQRVDVDAWGAILIPVIQRRK